MNAAADLFSLAVSCIHGANEFPTMDYKRAVNFWQGFHDCDGSALNSCRGLSAQACDRIAVGSGADVKETTQGFNQEWKCGWVRTGRGYPISIMSWRM